MRFLYGAGALFSAAVFVSRTTALPQDWLFGRDVEKIRPMPLPDGCRWHGSSWGTAVNLMTDTDAAVKAVVNLCWSNGTNGQTNSFRMGQRDVDVIKCLLDLHTTSPAICISTEGSKCDFDHYVNKNGLVNNVRISAPWIHLSGNDKNLTLPHAEVAKKAVQRMLNKTVPDESNQVVLITRDMDHATEAFREIHVNMNGGKLRC